MHQEKDAVSHSVLWRQVLGKNKDDTGKTSIEAIKVHLDKELFEITGVEELDLDVQQISAPLL